VDELASAVQKLTSLAFPAAGRADPAIGLRTAIQLLEGAGGKQPQGTSTNNTKLVILVHMDPFEAEPRAEVDALAHAHSVAVLDFPHPKWGMLENREPYWTQQLCLIESLVNKLDGAVPPNLNEIFFGDEPPNQQQQGSNRRRAAAIAAHRHRQHHTFSNNNNKNEKKQQQQQMKLGVQSFHLAMV